MSFFNIKKTVRPERILKYSRPNNFYFPTIRFEQRPLYRFSNAPRLMHEYKASDELIHLDIYIKQIGRRTSRKSFWIIRGYG